MNNIFINPGQLKKLSFVLSPWLASISVLLLVFGIWLSFFNSPIDYQQGNAVRMMYIHVPSAWLSMMIYVFLAVNSFFGLVYGHVTAFCLSKAAAPIGLTFTAICLVTGSAWGKPMWGAWWVWDARLTSVLILFFFYLGYIIFSKSFNDFTKGERFSSILSIIGIVNLPIIKFSVDYWNTLHQPASIIRFDGPSINQEMLLPLVIMLLGFLFMSIFIILTNIKTNLIYKKYQSEILKLG